MVRMSVLLVGTLLMSGSLALAGRQAKSPPNTPERLDECRALATQRGVTGAARTPFLTQCASGAELPPPPSPPQAPPAGPSTPPVPPAPETGGAPTREAAYARLREMLDKSGGVSFKHDTEKFQSSATLTGVKNAEDLYVLLYMARPSTGRAVIYPRYLGKFVNVSNARDRQGLERAMLRQNETSLSFWFVDQQGDIGAKFLFTIESGFPNTSYGTVAELTRSLDRRFAALRTFIDGTKPAP